MDSGTLSLARHPELAGTRGRRESGAVPGGDHVPEDYSYYEEIAISPL
jgi:hypothetical protein